MNTNDASKGGNEAVPSHPHSRNGAPESAEICATCGSSLQEWGKTGECLRCLVTFVTAPLDGVSNGEAAASVATQYGHFQISRSDDGLPIELGRGAMGATYRAHDTVLDCPIALKIIDQIVGDHPTAKSRFLREARAAAQFHHPNVARVSYYGEQEGSCYYAMELVEGETLEARVQREGPLSMAFTLEIAIQIARALSAAEAHGIIHRDLKPTNLMLTTQTGGPASRESLSLVKLIDFGLAKAVGAGARSTGPSDTRHGFVGTPAYASPEQFVQAADQDIDHRSDIYSLGVTMWYALTGGAPFTGRTLEEVRQRQRAPLPLEQLTAQGVTPCLVRLLQVMLSVDPADRPPSATRLLEGLLECQQQLDTVNGRRRMRPRSLAAAVSLGLLTVAAVILGLWWAHRLRIVPPTDRSIAVLPLETFGSNPRDTFYTDGVQGDLSANLARVAALKTVGANSTRSYLPGKRDFARISRELGVRYLLEGSVRREGGKVNIRVRLVDGVDGSFPWSQEYDRPVADAFAVQDEITRAVAARLQVPISTQEENAVRNPPTNDLAAYDLFLRARELPRLSLSTDDLFAVLSKQAELLDAAVARDPRFALAFCDLAAVHDSFYTFRLWATPEQRMIDHRALAESALEKARRLRPDLGEVHLAAAHHLFTTVHDHDQARIEADLARKTLPNNGDLESLAARIDRTQGRWEDAVRHYERAITLEPHEPEFRDSLSVTYHLMRRYDDYERTIRELQAILPAADAEGYDANAYVRLEKYADLAPLRAQVAGYPADKLRSGQEMDIVTLHLFERDGSTLARALAATQRTKYTINGCVYPKVWYVALAARLNGDEPGAQTAFAAARLEMEKVLLTDPLEGMNLSVLAMIDAGLGRTEEAIREGRRACDLRPPNQWARQAPVVRSNLAVVYAWSGQTDAAIDVLQELVKGPSGPSSPIQPSYGDFKLNPLWDALRIDPRFAVLTDSLAPSK